MEKDELRDIVKIKYPKVECDPNKAYEYFLKSRRSQKRIAFRNITIIFYTLLICFISVVTTIVLYDSINNQNKTKDDNNQTKQPIAFDIDSNKDAKSMVEIGMIDYCIAFGNNDNTKKYKSSILYNMNILSNDDIEALKEYDLENGVRYINLYFGVKDDKDIIVISYLEKSNDTYGTLIFDSNLGFKFDDLKEEFEDIIDENITIDFLNNRYQIYQDRRLPSGIYLELLEDNEQYRLKFTLYYKNQEHIIYK